MSDQIKTTPLVSVTEIDGRLHTLRRLFLHVTHGGQTNDVDRERVGADPTVANISHRIEQLEEIQRLRYEAAADALLRRG